MKLDRAARELSELIEAKNLCHEPSFVEWMTTASAVLRAAFGPESLQVRNFAAATQVRREGYVLSGGSRSSIEAWRGDAAERGRGVLRAAVRTLSILAEESPVDEASIDPELWTHVQGLIADSDWAKIPAAVAIFVEDRVRTWAGDPRLADGRVMVGKELYAKALKSDGMLRLGGQESESEGWRSLGMGLAQAIGNVVRHRIEQRADVRRYAMGVLGLGSLILTQLRYEHPARIHEAVAMTTVDEENQRDVAAETGA